jgi:hypothetical protein
LGLIKVAQEVPPQRSPRAVQEAPPSQKAVGKVLRLVLDTRGCHLLYLLSRECIVKRALMPASARLVVV